MKYKHIALLMLICVLGTISSLAQNNTLSILDVTVAPERTISLPINMDNTADVVAMQFTLTLPEGMSLRTNTAVLTDRADDHAVTLREIENGTYKAMIFSPSNKPFKGRTGNVMTVTLEASSYVKDGTVQQMQLSDVVLGARDGSDLTTSFSAGSITVSKSPDLTVSQVVPGGTVLQPGGRFAVNWSVSNIGELPSTGGWSERIFLKDDQGMTKLLGTLHYDGDLSAGGSVSRSAEITAPDVLSMHGDCAVEVKVTPLSNQGEPSWHRDNNTSGSEKSIEVKKTLFLSPATVSIEEARDKSIRMQITRSGSTLDDEVFTLTRNADVRITLPATVTIEKGQSSAYFYAQVTPNNVLDEESTVRLTIAGNGYPEVASTFNVEDDTYPSLDITTDAQDVTEGGSMAFTVSVQHPSSADIEVKMTCDLPKRFRIPEKITIPAGKTNVSVTVQAVEDEVPDVEEVVTFTVTAARYNPASINTVVVDNDVPSLQLEIMPGAVSEAAGPLAVTAKLRRTDNIDKVVTVKLDDDSDGGIYYGQQTIVLEKGVEEATINLGPVDNAIVDGERTYHISAAVWIASCSCNAHNGTSGGVVSVPLTVYDNDGPALAMTSPATILNEGSEMTITIKRNTSAAKTLTVSISSDHDAQIEYPKTVTIPSGQSETSFTVKSKSNDIAGDGFTAMLQAVAKDYAPGNIWFNVSDQTLPDAQVKAFASAAEGYTHGADIVFNATLINSGNAPMPAGTLVLLFESDSQYAVADVYTETAIAAGHTLDVAFCIKADLAIGKHSFYAKVNPKKANSELDYNNNSSAFASVSILSPFSTTTSVSKTVLARSEEVTISGKAVGSNVGNSEIDVYVINNGYRHVIPATTDDAGNFTVSYQPYENQAGHFSVGSCFHGDKVSTEQCAFDIYAIDVKNATLTCDVNKGETFTGSFILSNNGTLPLTNVKASLLSALPNAKISFSESTVTIPGGAQKELKYTITGIETSPKIAWQTVKVGFTCNEGAKATSDINFYIREQMAQLMADVAIINTSVTKGSTRDYHITISNAGKAETGKITFATPAWMHLDGGMQYVSSLATGESMEVTLVIDTADDMQLNVPKTGTIGINCDNGNGISIPYSVEPVSSLIGTLAIDVCDEFTYYTSEAPHVSGASIIVRHPTTGKEVASGTTGSDGCFTAELPEGYYAITVSANKHETVSDYVYVDPGRTRQLVVNLAYSAISYSWNVQETEVEDEYKLVTHVTYETNVPVPVVVLGLPKSIDGDNMKAGESVIVNLSVTNKGLITALNNNIQLPENTDEWLFEPLASIEPFDLPSQQSIVIPVRITRLIDDNLSRAKGRASNVAKNFNNCMSHVKDTYEAVCGEDMKQNQAVENMAMKMCAGAATGATIFDYLADVFHGSGFSNGSTGLGLPGGGPTKKDPRAEKDNTIGSGQSFSMCDTCDAQKAEALFEVFIEKTPLKNINAGMNLAIDLARNGGKPHREKLVLNREGLKQLFIQIAEIAATISEMMRKEALSNTIGFSIDMIKIIDILELTGEKCPKPDIVNPPKDPTPVRAKGLTASDRSWQTDYDEAALLQAEYMRNFYDIVIEIFGEEEWVGTDLDSKRDFVLAVAANPDLTDEQVLGMRPASVSNEQALRLYRRINGLDDANCVSGAKINDLIDKNAAMDEAAVASGYTSLADRFMKAYNVCAQKYKEKESSVCASITLEFSQRMVMTRQAFRGTLSVYNGHETAAMKDVRLALEIKDAAGNVSTSHEFQVNPESLKGFKGSLSLDGGWSLDADQTGEATILFIPTKYAAPTIGKPYSFGGTLSYVDPFTGLTVTRKLAPVTLTVNPSPNLDMTYFMQRNIIGDDPLTEEVEPSEEAEFSLLINNKGYGDAANVMMFTDQPRIIDNEKGLNIDFELMSSQLNGAEKTLALGNTVATNFGTIPAKGTSYAQWWIKSSLLGHFTSYNIEATHVTSYDNPDLSLLNDVTIHELIRSIEAEKGGTRLMAFLTNDIADAEDVPDMLYLTDGTTDVVSPAKNAEVKKVSDSGFSLTVTPASAGWTYGSVPDPTYGTARLLSVKRQSDGRELPLRNFWQTDRTLRDGKEPLYENRIHFADEIADKAGETYLLTFEPKPEKELEVDGFEGIPAEGVIAEAPVNKVQVVFSNYVDPATFTVEDITLSVQGKKMDVAPVTISTEDNKTFTLDISAISATAGNGYYLLTVNTAAVRDAEGFCGRNGKQADWVVFQDGKVSLSGTTYPVAAGTIQRVSDADGTGAVYASVDYGSTVRLVTTPNEGYEFMNWTVSGTVVSSDATFEYVALSDMDIVANYRQKTYDVQTPYTVTFVIDGAEQHAEMFFGDKITAPTPPRKDGYTFVGWSPEVDATVPDHDVTYVAIYEPLQDTEAVAISKWQYCTYSSDRNTDFTNSGITAYVATATNGYTVFLKKVSKLPAGTGALLYAKGGGEFTVLLDCDNCDEVTANYFVPVTSPITLGAMSDDGYSNCILTYDRATQSKFGFYPLGDDELVPIPAGKAYLSIPLDNVSTLLSVSLVILDEDEEETEAGSLFIDQQAGNVFINIAGIKSTRAMKGINITPDGKKIVK